jgi:hypothetical protein
VNKTRFTSNGHAAGRWDVDVYANDAGLEAVLASRGEAALGAELVEEHFERDGTMAGPIMMMQKQPKGFSPEHGDWRYVVKSGAGEVVRDGVIDSCAGCHDDAPHDRLFKVVE